MEAIGGAVVADVGGDWSGDGGGVEGRRVGDLMHEPAVSHRPQEFGPRLGDEGLAVGGHGAGSC